MKTFCNRLARLGLSTDITQDSEGRFSLNDFHKAAGGEAKHQVTNWLRLDSTQDLINEISQTSEVRFDPVSAIQGGAQRGTFVCKELVYAYAMVDQRSLSVEGHSGI